MSDYTHKKKHSLHIHCDLCKQTVTYRLSNEIHEKINAQATYFPYPIFFHHKDHFLFAYIDKSMKTARETASIIHKLNINGCESCPSPNEGFQYKSKNLNFMFAKDADYKALEKYAKSADKAKKIPVFVTDGNNNYWLIFMDHDLNVVSSTHSTLLLELETL